MGKFKPDELSLVRRLTLRSTVDDDEGKLRGTASSPDERQSTVTDTLVPVSVSTDSPSPPAAPDRRLVVASPPPHPSHEIFTVVAASVENSAPPPPAPPPHQSHGGASPGWLHRQPDGHGASVASGSSDGSSRVGRARPASAEENGTPTATKITNTVTTRLSDQHRSDMFAERQLRSPDGAGTTAATGAATGANAARWLRQRRCHRWCSQWYSVIAGVANGTRPSLV